MILKSASQGRFVKTSLFTQFSSTLMELHWLKRSRIHPGLRDISKLADFAEGKLSEYMKRNCKLLFHMEL